MSPFKFLSTERRAQFLSIPTERWIKFSDLGIGRSEIVLRWVRAGWVQQRDDPHWRTSRGGRTPQEYRRLVDLPAEEVKKTLPRVKRRPAAFLPLDGSPLQVHRPAVPDDLVALDAAWNLLKGQWPLLGVRA